MRLLLTGGTGFFGKTLLRYWQQAAFAGQKTPWVTVLSRNPQKLLAQHPGFAGLPWLSWHQGDMLVPASLPEYDGFTHILHAAADSAHGAQLTPMQRYDQIVDGTRNLLEYSAKNNIKRFLFVSSGGVYGAQPQGMTSIPEVYNGIADPLEVDNAYCVSKRCAEHLCCLYGHQYNIEAVIARCFSFVGCDLPMNVHFAVGNFIYDALFSDEIVVNGDGSPIRSYMDQRDLAYWLDSLLRFGRGGQAYNVGSHLPISIRELAHLVRDTLAPGKKVHIVSAKLNDSLRQLYVPATHKAEKELGLKLNYTLQQSIEDAARFGGELEV